MAAWTINWTSFSWETSPTTASTSAPASISADCTRVIVSALMSVTTNRAPSRAKMSAVARPIPDPAPVTTADLPLSRPIAFVIGPPGDRSSLTKNRLANRPADFHPACRRRLAEVLDCLAHALIERAPGDAAKCPVERATVDIFGDRKWDRVEIDLTGHFRHDARDRGHDIGHGLRCAAQVEDRRPFKVGAGRLDCSGRDIFGVLVDGGRTHRDLVRPSNGGRQHRLCRHRADALVAARSVDEEGAEAGC